MLPSVLALVVWLAVGARVAAEPGSSRALLGGALVRGAGAPAAGEHQQNENINGVAGKPPVVMTKRQSFDFRPLLVQIESSQRYPSFPIPHMIRA